jgi:hypothetical protein
VNSRALALCLSSAVAAVFATAPAAHGGPAAGQGAPPEPSVVRTVPPVAGVTFTVGGSSFTTDGAGRVVLPLRPDVPLFEQVRVGEARVGPTVKASFGRWYGRVRSNNVTATMGYHYRIHLSLSGPPGAALGPESISHVRLKSSTGQAITIRSDEIDDPLWVAGTRVVALGGGLESKDIEYSVASVRVRGAEAVNRGEQRFVPRTTRVFRIATLWYRVRFTSRDLLFNSPIGSALVLTYPDGSVDRITFDQGAEVTLPAIPRGRYTVKVDAPGTSFTRPFSLSKDQTVDLEVLSYVDTALILGVLAAVAAGLLVLGRGRHLLRLFRLRPRARVPLETEAPES